MVPISFSLFFLYPLPETALFHESIRVGVSTEVARLPAAVAPTSDELTGARHWRDLARCSTAEARARVPFEIAERLCALPLQILTERGGREALVVIFGGEEDPQRARELRFVVGLEIISDFADEQVVARACIAAYRGASWTAEALERACSEVLRPALNSAPLERFEISDSPVPALLDSLLDTAIAEGASDIYFEPRSDLTLIRMRVDGQLRDFPGLTLPARVSAALSRRLKVLAKLDSTALHTPQEGSFRYENGVWSVSLRYSSLPTPSGERIVLRLLSNSVFDDLLDQATVTGGSNRRQLLTRLGLLEGQEKLLRAVLGGDGGAVVLSGPTGSGKSTLLAAAVLQFNPNERSVVTIEDPIERILPGITQTEVNRDYGLDYSDLLTPLLRQDPDVIVLGEIRDSRAAKTALSAAVTGHLVLTTVHAGNCLEVFLRLSQLDVPQELLALAVRLVVSQRLIPRNCRECKREVTASRGLCHWLRIQDGTRLFESHGCNACRLTGIQGRVGVFEFLPVGRSMREALLAAPLKASSAEKSGEFRLQEAALASGYEPLAVRVRDLLLEGEIAPSQALRAIGVSPELFGYL